MVESKNPFDEKLSLPPFVHVQEVRFDEEICQGASWSSTTTTDESFPLEVHLPNNHNSNSRTTSSSSNNTHSGILPSHEAPPPTRIATMEVEIPEVSLTANRIVSDSTISSSSLHHEEETPLYDPSPSAIVAEVPQMDDLPTPRRVVVSAGLASGLVGLLVGGPFLAIILGWGAARAAQSHRGAVGDLARAVGDLALLARERAAHINQQHRAWERACQALQQWWQRSQAPNGLWDKVRRTGTAVQDWSQRNHVPQRMQETGDWAWRHTQAWAEREQVVERTERAVQQGWAWVVHRLQHYYEHHQYVQPIEQNGPGDYPPQVQEVNLDSDDHPHEINISSSVDAEWSTNEPQSVSVKE